jgi:hypothetical protein
LLAALSELNVPEPKSAFAERLSLWLGWTDAISLSAALDGGPARTPSPSPAAPRSAGTEESELARVRTALTNSIAEHCRCTATSGRRTPAAPTPRDDAQTAADFTTYRRRYNASQQAMESSIGPLRQRVREVAAGATGAVARLAAVDAVMEQALGARERALLSTVPTRLEKHFERLRHAHEQTRADTQEPDDPHSWVRPGGWLEVFCKDMRAVLLAELDLRLQPVEGLLEALSTESHMA